MLESGGLEIGVKKLPLFDKPVKEEFAALADSKSAVRKNVLVRFQSWAQEI